MIKANCVEGNLRCRGTTDEILTEYALITRMILNELIRITNEETAYKILEEIGEITVEDLDKDPRDVIEKIYNKISEVLCNAIPV